MSQLNSRYPSIEDCRKGARRRLPGFLFDFLDGGTGDETAVSSNRSAYKRIKIVSEIGRSVIKPDLSTHALGKQWQLPFGVCPCGYVDMLAPGTERAAAIAAQKRGAPFIASLSTITPLEELAALAPASMWLQVLAMTDQAIMDDIVKRAATAGVEAIVVTMDCPISSRRTRDIRNGFTLPLRPTIKILTDILRSPSWMLDTLRNPVPKPGNFLPYLPDGITSTKAALELEEMLTATNWADLERFRDQWSGTLIVKGVLAPKDAVKAVDIGADGVIVSNHGGRQFDAAPPPIDRLPIIADAVGDRATVMLDSGIRSGLDMMKAALRGAQLIFSGRSFYYAAGAMGISGPAHAFDLLKDELANCMTQTGFQSMAEIQAADWRSREAPQA